MDLWIFIPGIVGILLISFCGIVIYLSNPIAWRNRWAMVPGGIRMAFEGPMPIVWFFTLLLALVFISAPASFIPQ